MPSEPSVFDKKPVFDWNHVPVGHVASAVRDPKTRDTRHIVLTLSAQARKELGTREETLELPASLVFATRRDAVTLDRSLTELRKIGQLTTLLKK